jgi:H+/Cl- antiporter ClcA
MIFCSNAMFAVMGLWGLVAIRENVVKKTRRFSRAIIITSFIGCAIGLFATHILSVSLDLQTKQDAKLVIYAIAAAFFIQFWQYLSKTWWPEAYQKGMQAARKRVEEVREQRRRDEPHKGTAP